MKTPIWAVTRSNDPYTYIRANNWHEALAVTTSNRRISKQAQIDGGFAMSRLMTEDIPGIFRRFWGIQFWDDIPERNKADIIRIYTSTRGDIPADPAEFLTFARQPAQHPLPQPPLVPAPRLHSAVHNTTLICPDTHLDDPVDWAIYEMLKNTDGIAATANPRMFSYAEIEEIRAFRRAT